MFFRSRGQTHDVFGSGNVGLDVAMKMTKQKIYEKAIMKTFEYRLGPQVEKEMRQLKEIPKTFPELMMKRDLFGFRDNIPRKHPFETLGFSYVHQILGMCTVIRDDSFTCDVFEFLCGNKDIVDFHRQDHMDVCYDLYYETLCGENRYETFNRKMGDFILRNFDRTLEYYDKALTLAYTFFGCEDMTLGELVNIRKELGK